MGTASITLTPTNTAMTEQLAFLKEKVTTKSKCLVQLLAKRVLGWEKHRF